MRMSLSVIVAALGVFAAGVSAPSPSRAASCVPSWRPVPSRAAAKHEWLNSVSARSLYDAWAVGRDYTEHWNGATWSIVPPARGGGSLDDVTVTSNGEAWAVGFAGRSALIEHWDGRRWERTPLAASAAHAQAAVGRGGYRVLRAVSGTDASNLWAVGWDERAYTSAQIRSGTFVEPDQIGVVLHWDGRTWTRIPLPRRWVTDRSLRDVAVTSRGTVWLVGDSSYADGSAGAALRWDGRRWQFFRLPAPSGADGVAIRSVAAVGADSVVAVGDAATTAGHLDGETWGLLFRFGNGTWTRRVPDYHGSFSFYEAVAARSPREVWIAQDDADPFNFAAGAQLFTGLHAGRPRTQLGMGQIIIGLAADSDGIWAVGGTGSGRADENDYDYANWRPLIERYGCATT